MDQIILDRLAHELSKQTEIHGRVLYVIEPDGSDPDAIRDDGLNDPTRALLEREGYRPVPAYEALPGGKDWDKYKLLVHAARGFVIPTPRGTFYLIASEWWPS